MYFSYLLRSSSSFRSRKRSRRRPGVIQNPATGITICPLRPSTPDKSVSTKRRISSFAGGRPVTSKATRSLDNELRFVIFHWSGAKSLSAGSAGSADMRRNVALASSRQTVLLTQKELSRLTCPATRAATNFPRALRFCGEIFLVAAMPHHVHVCSSLVPFCLPNGIAKLSSCPSGSVRWKNRSPQGASLGAFSGCRSWDTARA